MNRNRNIIPPRLKYLLIFATVSFFAYLVDDHLPNLSGFAVGAMAVMWVRLKTTE